MRRRDFKGKEGKSRVMIRDMKRWSWCKTMSQSEKAENTMEHNGERGRGKDEVTHSIMTQVHKTPLVYILTLKINKWRKMNELKEN